MPNLFQFYDTQGKIFLIFQLSKTSLKRSVENHGTAYYIFLHILHVWACVLLFCVGEWMNVFVLDKFCKLFLPGSRYSRFQVCRIWLAPSRIAAVDFDWIMHFRLPCNGFIEYDEVLQETRAQTHLSDLHFYSNH